MALAVRGQYWKLKWNWELEIEKGRQNAEMVVNNIHNKSTDYCVSLTVESRNYAPLIYKPPPTPLAQVPA